MSSMSSQQSLEALFSHPSNCLVQKTYSIAKVLCLKQSVIRDCFSQYQRFFAFPGEFTMLTKPIYKITLLGDFAVGKTSLRHRFMGDFFDTSYMMTIGADFASKMINVEDRQIKFQIWDLAGQPRFSAVRKLYYRSAVGALLVFDITTPESYRNVQNWVEELWKHNGSGVLPIILLGNKLDLRDKFSEAITSDQGNAMAKQLSERTQEEGFDISYLETSAKTGKNVNQAFHDLGLKISGFVAQRRKQ